MPKNDAVTSTEQLNDIITENLALHKNNRVTIADFMFGLLLAGTVNLNKIANYSSRAGKMSKENIYRGYQNLIHTFKLSQAQLAIGIMKMFGLLGNCQVILAMDRTNWQYGGKDNNLLVLSVVVNGCGVPLFWIELDTKGNSDTVERKQIMDMFIEAFGAEKIRYVLADREFIGEDWFTYLDDKKEDKIKFIIRIKSNMLIDTNDNNTIGCSCESVSNARFNNNDKLSKDVVYLNRTTNEIKYYLKKAWHIIQFDLDDISSEDTILYAYIMEQANKQQLWVPKDKLPQCLQHIAHMITAGELCHHATKTNILTFYGKVGIHDLKIQSTRSTEGDLVIVVSNDLQSMELLSNYGKRWAIECLFANLKTKGFNFEDTHFTDKVRLGNLTKLLALALAIALLLGIIKSISAPIMIKKHGRKEHSYFRYGHDLLITMIMRDIQRVIRLIQLCFLDLEWSERIKVITKELYAFK